MQPRRAELIVERVGALARRLRRVHPALLLVPMIAVELGVAAWFALHTPHNGYVWYSGGDATEYWTEQWAVGHMLLPQPPIGWGLPVLYAWVPLLTGTTILNGLPVIVLLQATVLVPLATVLLFFVAERLYGRLFAVWASALWVAAPVLLVLGFQRHDYREAFAQEVIAPHWFGLTNMADFPSLVLILGCALALLRTLDGGRDRDALLAGLLIGLLIGLKPANAFFLPAAAVLLVATRRPRTLLLAAVAIAPALLTLAVWKQRGLGYLPLTSYVPLREALGPAPMLLGVSLRDYIPWDPHHLGRELSDLREVFWSVRVLEFLAIGGAVGALRRLPTRGLFLVLWFAAFMLVKGSYRQANISDASYFRLTLPGLPAFLLLSASVVFLVPRLGRRMAAVRPAPRAVSRSAVAAVALLTGVIPLAVLLAAHSAASPRFARDNATATEAPISGALTPRVQLLRDRARLSWHPVRGGGATAHYVLFRAAPGTDGCTLPTRGAMECFLAIDSAQPLAGTSAVVPRGQATYRVAAAANNTAAVNGSDLILLGPPVRVR